MVQVLRGALSVECEVCVCEQFADLSNDRSSAENHCSNKLPLNESKYADSVDINSNALVEPNRETQATRLTGKDSDVPVSSSTSRLSQVAATSVDGELTSVAHMLDVANAANFCTLLAPSLKPPKMASAVSSVNEKTAKPDDTASVDAAESVANAIARDIIQRNQVCPLNALVFQYL